MFAANNNGRTGVLARETVKHVNNLSSKVAQIFTSSTNTEALHEAIRYRVHVESGGKFTVGRQSDTELAIVMRSIMLQYGNNNDNMDVLKQVRALNKAVLDYCVEKVLVEVQSYARYRVDSSRPHIPIAHAQPSSIKGTGERSLDFGATHFF